MFVYSLTGFDFNHQVEYNINRKFDVIETDLVKYTNI